MTSLLRKCFYCSSQNRKFTFNLTQLISNNFLQTRVTCFTHTFWEKRVMKDSKFPTDYNFVWHKSWGRFYGPPGIAAVITQTTLTRPCTSAHSSVNQRPYRRLGRRLCRKISPKCKCQQVVSYKQREQVCVEPPPSALNMTLPAFVAERWRLQHGARSYLSMSPADRALSSKPAGHRRRGRQTDGRTDA